LRIDVIKNIESLLNRYMISGLQLVPDSKRHKDESDISRSSFENTRTDLKDIATNIEANFLDAKTEYSEIDDIGFESFVSYDSMNPQNKSSHTITIERLVRDTRLSKQLKELYKNTCQLCGKQVKGRNRQFISEAHHIQPYNSTHEGDDTFKNLIVLCPNCHAQFDQLYYAINPETEDIHCIAIDDLFHLSRLSMDTWHVLGKEYLRYTWELFCGKLNRDY